jgi:SAM-dependent methyltransferase
MQEEVNQQNICLNCGSEDSTPYLNASDIFHQQHQYYKCDRCGLVFIFPLPSDDILARAYDTSYYGEGDTEKFNSSLVVKFIDRMSKRRALRFAAYLPAGGRIMDVGCGNGRFLEHLHGLRKKFDLNGIEVNAKAALRASERLKSKAWIHTVTDLETFFGKNAFHGISYIHVFEHIDNPVVVMNQLKKVIRPDGVVMIVIPNIESRQAKRFGSHWLHLDPPRHIHFYPPKLLCSEMEKRGFTLIREKYSDPEQNPYGAVQSMLNRMLKKRDVLFERLKGNHQYAPEYKKFHVLLMKLFLLLTWPVFLLSDFSASMKKQSATAEFVFKKHSDGND